MSAFTVRLIVMLSLAVAVVRPAPAAAQTRFYQGKQLSILVNFDPGGPTDTEARLLARHLGGVLRGKPGVSVRNMAGDQGVAAANWLAVSAPADGLTLGYLTDTAAKAVVGHAGLEPKVADLAIVASRTGFSVAYARSATGSGIKIPTDVLRQKTVVVGGQSPAGDIDIRLRMQFDLVGANYRYQPGFESASSMRQAFLHGDVDVLMERLTAYNAAIEPGPVAKRSAIPLWFDPLDDGSSFSRSPAADGIPALTFTDFLIARSGRLPDSDLFNAWRVVNQIGTRFLRTLALAPGSPAAAVSELREALRQLADNQAFREDAIKSLRLVPVFETSVEIGSFYRTALAPEPRLKSLIHSYAGSSGPGRPGLATGN